MDKSKLKIFLLRHVGLYPVLKSTEMVEVMPYYATV